MRCVLYLYLRLLLLQHKEGEMKKVNNTFKTLLGLALLVLTVMALGYAIAHSEENSITIGENSITIGVPL